jgi:hypothetical protein
MEISLPRHDIIAHKIFNLNASGRQDWFPSLAICHGSTTALHDTNSRSLSFDLRRIFQKFMFHISARQLQAVFGMEMAIEPGKQLLCWQHDWSYVLETSCCLIVHTVLFCRLFNVKQSRTS